LSTGTLSSLVGFYGLRFYVFFWKTVIVKRKISVNYGH
jgi:hypothetical protein